MSLLMIFLHSHLQNQMMRKKKNKMLIECAIIQKIEREESELIKALQEELDESIFLKD